MVEGGAGWGMLEYYRRLYEKANDWADPGKAKEPEPMVTAQGAFARTVVCDHA